MEIPINVKEVRLGVFSTNYHLIKKIPWGCKLIKDYNGETVI